MESPNVMGLVVKRRAQKSHNIRRRGRKKRKKEEAPRRRMRGSSMQMLGHRPSPSKRCFLFCKRRQETWNCKNEIETTGEKEEINIANRLLRYIRTSAEINQIAHRSPYHRDGGHWIDQQGADSSFSIPGT